MPSTIIMKLLYIQLAGYTQTLKHQIHSMIPLLSVYMAWIAVHLSENFVNSKKVIKVFKIINKFWSVYEYTCIFF